NREHVTDAAETLHGAQSAVSRQIANLETELGVDLFIREGRQVKLTPIGRIFLNRMEKAVNVIDDAVHVGDEYIDPEKGMIHIGFLTSLSTYVLLKALYHFSEEYLEVIFDLHQGSCCELYE